MSKALKTQKQRAAAERRRLEKLLASAPEGRRKALAPIIENVAWMRVKLDVARDEIADDSTVTGYDNGGGQKGVHENPAFRGYTALWKSYMQGMEKILAAIPVEAASAVSSLDTEPARPQTVLELVRQKKAGSA